MKDKAYQKRPYEIVSSEIAWSCPWYSVRKDQIRLPDGRAGEYNVVEKSGAVFVLPITAEGEIILINVYRHTVDAWCWEIPAGSIKEGQTAEDAAEAELLEEVGGTADELILLGQFYTANGICNELSHLFVATAVTLGETAHEPLEVMTVHRKTADEVRQMVREGLLKDGLSALAIMLAESHLRDGVGA